MIRLSVVLNWDDLSVQEPEYNDTYETRRGGMRGKSCSPSLHYIGAKIVHYELTKGEMGRCGSFKDNLSHGLTNLALLVVEGIIAGKRKWKLMYFLIKVSCFYLTKHKMISYGSSFGCHQ